MNLLNSLQLNYGLGIIDRSVAEQILYERNYNNVEIDLLLSDVVVSSVLRMYSGKTPATDQLIGLARSGVLKLDDFRSGMADLGYDNFWVDIIIKSITKGQ